MSVHVCLSRLSLCGPVIYWRPVQGVPRRSPDDRWDRLQPPRDLTDGLSGYRKWMDGWIFKPLKCKKKIAIKFYSTPFVPSFQQKKRTNKNSIKKELENAQ